MSRSPAWNLRRAACAAAALSCVLQVAAVHAAPPKYRVVLLPLPADATDSFGLALNNNGEAAGKAAVAGSPTKAVAWRAGGGVQILGDLSPGDSTLDPSYAADMNDSGQIVGTTFPPATNGGVAVLWHANGSAVALGDFKPGSYSEAYAINEAGVAAGAARSPRSGYHAFVWTMQEGLRVLPITMPSGSGTKESYGVDLNIDGTVVGFKDVQRSLRGERLLQGYAWSQAGGTIDIGTAAFTGAWSFATAINDLGVIAGTLGPAKVSDGTAFVWTPAGGVQPLPLPPGSHSFRAVSINNRSEVIGTYTANGQSTLISHAFLWSGAEGTLDLASLIEAGDPLKAAALQALIVTKINDTGAVIGTITLPSQGTDTNRAVLLVPVP